MNWHEVLLYGGRSLEVCLMRQVLKVVLPAMIAAVLTLLPGAAYAQTGAISGSARGLMIWASISARYWGMRMTPWEWTPIALDSTR